MGVLDKSDNPSLRVFCEKIKRINAYRLTFSVLCCIRRVQGGRYVREQQCEHSRIFEASLKDTSLIEIGSVKDKNIGLCDKYHCFHNHIVRTAGRF